MLVFLPAAPALAQEAPREPSTTLSGGYQFMKDFGWRENLNIGWVASLTQRMTTHISIVAEAGGSHGEFGETGFTIQRYAFLGGMRLSGGEGSVKPFVQVLVGQSRQGGDVGRVNGLAVQSGGGADITLDNGLTLRVQADIRTAREDGTWWRQFRAAGSVVWTIRRR
jgi:hypothetical protein